MVNVKSASPRRREVRKKTPRPGPAWIGWLHRRDVEWAVLFMAGFTILAAAVTIGMGQARRYYLGEVMTHAVVSRVAFQHEDEAKTREAQNQARAGVPNVYTANAEYLNQLRDRFANLIALADYEDFKHVPQRYRDQVDLTAKGLSELKGYLAHDNGLSRWKADTDRFLRNLFGLALLTPDRYQEERFHNIKIVNPVPGPDEPTTQYLPPSKFYSIDNKKLLEAKLEGQASVFPPDLQRSVAALVMRNLEPTYQFDEKLTQEAKDKAVAGVVAYLVAYQPGQLLVNTGDKLGPDDLVLLKQEHEAYEAQRSTLDRVLTGVGRGGLVLLIAIGLWCYIFAYKYRIVENPMRGFALLMLLVGCQFLAVALTQWQPAILYATATFPTLMAVMVLAIVYDQRFALAVGGFHTVLIMLSLNLPIGFGIVLLTGLGMAVTMLHEVRTRSRVVVVGMWSGGAMGAAALLTALADHNLAIAGELERILTQETLTAVLTGLGTGMVVQVSLPAIERIFKVTTAMTLKELNDASHPLLQRLAQEAPGTYQHSLRIADMAESAAEAIGANGLLCRVGAMYHDIGKINKPLYFIENQGGGPNRHSKLSPAMSLLIIVGHVKDGIEMAREFGIPPVIRHFIESHHGTTLVEYFYHAARKKKEEQDEELPSEFEFRYPGPKPQTREAAILLLCDSIEATARTLDEPTPIRLEQLVHTMANKRLMDGQFDQSNLTLQDLYKIEQAITKMLNAIYHARVKYPKGEGESGERKAGDQAAGQAKPAAVTAPQSVAS